MNEPQLEPLVPLFILGFYIVGLAVERVVSARPLPAVRGWNARAAGGWLVTLVTNAVVPMAAAAALTGAPSLGLDRLGFWVGTLVTFLISDLANYWLHRGMHRSPGLWRWTHQVHHSAERVDVMGSAWFHPLDMALQAGLSTLVVLVLGVSPDVAALAGLLNVALAVFQHLNIRTPLWLGYLLQRPENHSVHHERGVHAYNYGNLSIWDILFGTFRNVRDFAPEAGFYDGASARVREMLLGRDVSEPAP